MRKPAHSRSVHRASSDRLGRGLRLLEMLALAVVVASLGACARTAAEQPAPSTVPAPVGDLYTPPDPLVRAPAGTLIWAEEVKGLPLHPASSVWRLLYHSRSRDGHDIAVSGFAIVPAAAPPDGGRPVFAWAHGTVGLGDQCAPSHQVRDNLPPYGGQQLERGAVLVATDYQGLGTPGVPTSTVALAEGHAVLDSVRAVAALPGVGALGDVVVAGHSQGGRAALVAAEIAATYAPGLHLVAALALAPGAELPTLVDHLVTTAPGAAMALIGAIGMAAGYPSVDLSSVFTPSAVEDVARIQTECLDATMARYARLSTSEVIRSLPGTRPKLQALLSENSPGAVEPGVPVFLGRGDADQQVPAQVLDLLTAKYCAMGASVERHAYPGVDHDSVIDAAVEDAVAFLTARYEHRRAAGEC